MVVCVILFLFCVSSIKALICSSSAWSFTDLFQLNDSFLFKSFNTCCFWAFSRWDPYQLHVRLWKIKWSFLRTSPYKKCWRDRGCQKIIVEEVQEERLFLSRQVFLFWRKQLVWFFPALNCFCFYNIFLSIKYNVKCFILLLLIAKKLTLQ